MEHKLVLINSEIVYLDGELLDKDESLAVRSHSPDGFSWGYLGSGCAQLALAVLLRMNPEKASLTYGRFKQEVIARVPQNGQWIVRFTADVDADGALRFAIKSVDKIPIIKLRPS